MDDDAKRQIFKDLVRFVHWIASVNEVRGHWMLSRDDIEGEAWLAVSRVFQKYPGKEPDEMKLICRTAIANSVRTLKYKGLQTFRKQEYYAPSLDDEDVIIASEFDLQLLAESSEWVDAFLQSLTPLEKEIVMVLFGNKEVAERVHMYVELYKLRLQHSGRNRTIKLTSEIIARVLCEPVSDTKKAMRNIKKKVRAMR